MIRDIVRRAQTVTSSTEKRLGRAEAKWTPSRALFRLGLPSKADTKADTQTKNGSPQWTIFATFS
jgi:hypothetical protein